MKIAGGPSAKPADPTLNAAEGQQLMKLVEIEETRWAEKTIKEGETSKGIERSEFEQIQNKVPPSASKRQLWA